MFKKSTLLTIISFFSISIYAQTGSLGVDGNLVNFQIFDADDYKGPDVEGTPYVIEDFREAKINKDDKLYKVRYNANTDQIEVDLEASGIIILDNKGTEYSIEFIDSGEKYVTVNSLVAERNYGKVLWENDKNQKLLKIEKIGFTPSKVANGYVAAQKAKYTNLKEDLYFYDGKAKEAIELPNSANKKIRELFDGSAKKYIKSQDWDMNNEKDLIKALEKFYGE